MDKQERIVDADVLLEAIDFMMPKELNWDEGVSPRFVVGMIKKTINELATPKKESEI